MFFDTIKNRLRCRKIRVSFKKRKRYLFLDWIGRGGLARIGSYFDTYLHRIVAIKELKKKHYHNPYILQSFITESKLISYLDHPGIVPLFDVLVKKKNKLCYTMKLVDGVPLTHLLSHAAHGCGMSELTMNQYLAIFKKICETLLYAHDKGVIHLDLKPDNIMVGPYGEVMIMDWGNARLYNKEPYYEFHKRFMNDPTLASIDQESDLYILGTPQYMSPEQTKNSRETLKPMSDIFSAGIILYEMMTGIHPFSEPEDTSEILTHIRANIPKPIHELNSEIPVRLSRIGEKMLEKDPEDRYQSFAEVLDDINEFYNSGQAFPIRTFNTGEIIVREGEIGEFAFTIVSGRVEVFKEVESRQKVLATLGEGDIVGEISIIARQPRTATVRALEPTIIRIMQRQSVDKELEKLSPWVGAMITALSERFIGLNEKVASL